MVKVVEKEIQDSFDAGNLIALDLFWQGYENSYIW